jgi:hypothetical protein
MRVDRRVARLASEFTPFAKLVDAMKIERIKIRIKTHPPW